MRKQLSLSASAISILFASAAFAQTPPPAPNAATTTDTPAATTTAPATGTADQRQSVNGVSVKDNIMGKNVYNENGDKVGDIRDVILEDDTVTHYIVGVGGFLGLGEHDVLLPKNSIQGNADRYTLSGYTKDQLKDLPKAEVRK